MNLPPYPRYKRSGVEWLGDVPEHWDVDRLKWTTTGTINGIWGEEPNGIDDVICVRVADFDRDHLVVVNEPPTLRTVSANDRKQRLLRRGDLLVEKSGGGEKQLVGCVVLFDHTFEAVCSNFVARMPVATAHYGPFWIYVHAALYAGRLNYPAIKQTTGIQNLDEAAYLATRVAFPPLAEQQAIATLLNRETGKIDAMLAKKRTLIERLKEKRTALIARTVTRGLPPDAARAASFEPHPKLKPSGIDWLGDVPEHWSVVRLGRKIVLQRGVDITKDDQNDGVVPVVSSGGIASFHDRALAPGEGVVVGRKGTAGAVYYIPVPFWPHDTTLWVEQFGGNHPRFVYFKLLSMNLSSFDTGSANPTVNRNLVHPTFVSWPPVSEQIAIARFLDRETGNIDSMVAKTETAIERLQEYRSALITAAVTGKIDVREV